MNRRALSLLLIFELSQPLLARAEIASGGAFVMDQSLIAGTQQISSGGNYSLTGSIGEGFSHATGINQALKYPQRRIFDGFLSPLWADPTRANSISLDNGNILINIPARAFPLPYQILVETDPMNYPIIVDPHLLSLANQRILLEAGSPLSLLELRILLSDGTIYTRDSALPASYRVSYTNSGEGPVVVRHLDDTGGVWQKFLGEVSVSAGTPANFSPYRSGVFGLFEQAAGAPSLPYAFPVPWRPNHGNTGQYGSSQTGITFANLTAADRIRIYNLAGELVRDIDVPSGTTQLRWDGRNGSGSEAASGVYIWAIEKNGGRETGKLMIIR